MSITKATPYLFFSGNAEQAIELYQRALGAKVEGLIRYGEQMENCPQADKRRIMHALLHVGQAPVMISDTPSDHRLSVGTNVEVCLDFDNVEELTRCFEALSASGKVTMPLEETFWAAKFGSLVDAFGVPWMFNGPAKAP